MIEEKPKKTHAVGGGWQGRPIRNSNILKTLYNVLFSKCVNTDI